MSKAMLKAELNKIYSEYYVEFNSEEFSEAIKNFLTTKQQEYEGQTRVDSIAEILQKVAARNSLNFKYASVKQYKIMKKSIEDLRQKEIDQVHEEIKKMEEKLANSIIANKIDPCTEKLTYEAIRKREKYKNEIDGIKVKLVNDISCFYEDVQSKLEQFRKKKHVIFSVENFLVIVMKIKFS